MAKYNPDVHHRQSARLKDYDYSQSGAYFITICAQNRKCLFGEIKNAEMELNEAGKMVQAVWKELPQYHPGFEMDGFVAMPNHVHGIILLAENVGVGLRAYPPANTGKTSQQTEQPKQKTGQPPLKTGQPRRAAPTITLPDIVHHFKSFTTAQYRQNVAKFDWPPFPGKLWQRNYFEHIICSDESLYRIREYIANNPARWEFDLENPTGNPDKREGNFWKTVGVAIG